MRYNLTISVVLYNTEEDEILNIVNIISRSNLNTKLFFIDNSPSDILKTFVVPSDTVEYIHTGKNLGFGAGHNIAINIAKSTSEFHLVLNADVSFEVEILERIYSFMKDNDEVGLVAPKILNPDRSIQYSIKLLPTPANLIVRRFLPIRFIQKRMNYKYELQFFDFDRIVEVPYVMGCFMFIKTKVFEAVDGFDERFFMYPEDIDLTRRIHQKYRTLYFPETEIIHKHGKGSYKSRKLLYYHITSMIKYFNKWGWIFDKERRILNKKILSQFEM